MGVSTNSNIETIGISLPLDTDNEGQLGLFRDVEVALMASNASKADLFTLSIAVLLDVRLSTLEDNAALFLVGLLESLSADIRKCI